MINHDTSRNCAKPLLWLVRKAGTWGHNSRPSHTSRPIGTKIERLHGVCVEPAGEVTILLGRIESGGQDALAALMPLVYKELRRLAGHFLREERVGHTLQPTALVHEAYLCLIGQDRAIYYL